MISNGGATNSLSGMSRLVLGKLNVNWIVLVNNSWLSLFLCFETNFLLPGIFDHSPSITTVGKIPEGKPKPFKFFDMWIEHPTFLDVVKDSWTIFVDGNPLFQVVQKLKATKARLKEWNRTIFGMIDPQLKHAREELYNIQDAHRQNWDDSNLAVMEKEVAVEYSRVLELEESLLRQKSRFQWLELGDANNSFFHRSLMVRRNRNQINHIQKEDGSFMQEENEIRDAAEMYFQNILAPSPHCGIAQSTDCQPKNCLNQEQQDSLTEEVTDEEIKDVLWHMKESKALGPDEFTVTFFKHAWDIMGKDVTEAIQYIFNSGRLLRETNSTFISLIPKMIEAMKFSEFRPISLCNLLYKIIMKIMDNRMQGVMNFLVRENQTAFIKGRSISENILLCHEVVHGFERKTHPPLVILKIDIRKAYDSVSWEFIHITLHKMHF